MRAFLLASAVALLPVAARAADEDDEFMRKDDAEDGAPGGREATAWPSLARFDPSAGGVSLTWPDGGDERIATEDLVRFERARPFESRPDELFLLLSDGRRILVSRGADVEAHAALAPAVMGLAIKEMPAGQGHFRGAATAPPTRFVVGRGGGVAVRAIAMQDVTARNAAPAAASTGEVDDPAIAGEGGGELDKVEIDVAIKQRMPSIRACYEKELRRDPELAGRVTVRFVIDRSGAVKYAALRASDLDNPLVESCVVSEVRDLRFPAPRGTGTVVVSYPFVFSAGG